MPPSAMKELVGAVEENAKRVLEELKTRRQEKEEEEPEVEPEPEAEALDWMEAEHGADYYPVLSRRAPLDIAKKFAEDHLSWHAIGRPSARGTFYYRGKWWQWNKAFYEKAPEQRLTDMICNFLDRAKASEEGGALVRFRPTTKDLSGVATFLRSNVGLDDRLEPLTLPIERRL